MTWLIALLRVLLEAVLPLLLPAAVKASEPASEDGAPQTEIRDRLRERVRRTWGPAAILLFLVLLTGCGSRTVYVREGEPVRLRETVHAAKVWVMGSDGKPVAGTMDLPEGWYCLSMPAEEPKP